MHLERADTPSGAGAGSRDPLVSLLTRAADYFGRLWPDRSAYAAQIGELRARLVEQRLQIALLGQFKRGKSTLLNALLGRPVLPTGVVPITAIPTFIRWGSVPSIEVSYLDDRPPDRLPAEETEAISAELFRLVTEEGNPHNRAKVARVDVSLPAPILGNGIVLIDTPGVGSTYQHNTDAAIRVLPDCDAAFFVLSVDPPVTAAELEYLDRVRLSVARLFFILNKVDYLAEAERSVAADFLRRTLREHTQSGADIRIFNVSARRALEAKQAGNADGVAESGLVAVEHYLAEFLAREKPAALRHAIATKSAALLDAAGMEIALGIRAFEMPIEDLEMRAARFSEALREIERQRRAAQDLFAGDRRRALGSLEACAAALREDGRAAFLAVLERTLAGEARLEQAEDTAKTAIAKAIPEFFGPKLEEVSRAFSREVEETLAQHVGAAEHLITSVRQNAGALFNIPSTPAGGADRFVMAREPFWVTQKWDQTIGSLAAGALEKLLPAGLHNVRMRKRLSAEVDDLVQRNVENLRWATLQNLEHAFRCFSSWFDERLAEAIGATQGAIEAALTKRLGHEEQVQDDLSRLREAADWIAAAQCELMDIQRLEPADRLDAEAVDANDE